jgi:hypothetical protein
MIALSARIAFNLRVRVSPPRTAVLTQEVSGFQTIAPVGAPAVIPHAVPNPIEPDSDAMGVVRFLDLASWFRKSLFRAR